MPGDRYLSDLQTCKMQNEIVFLNLGYLRNGLPSWINLLKLNYNNIYIIYILYIYCYNYIRGYCKQLGKGFAICKFASM